MSQRILVELLIDFIIGLLDFIFALIECIFSVFLTLDMVVISAIVGNAVGVFVIMIAWRVSKSKQMKEVWRISVSWLLYVLGGLSLLINLVKLIFGGLWLW
jgi:hypothetical protein